MHPDYYYAGLNIQNRIEALAANDNMHPEAPAAPLHVEKVTIAGAPREGAGVHTAQSFAERFSRDYEHGDPADSLSITVHFKADADAPRSPEKETDLRAASEPDVKKGILTAIRGALEPLGIAGRYEWGDAPVVAPNTDTPPASPLIVPSLALDTSDTGGTVNGKVFVHLDLPDGVTHQAVIKSLAEQYHAKPVLGPATENVTANGDNRAFNIAI